MTTESESMFKSFGTGDIENLQTNSGEDGDYGLVKVRFAKFSQQDKGGDYFDTGSIPNNHPVYMLGWEHDKTTPIGFGKTITDDEYARAELKMPLNSEKSKHIYEMIKLAGENQRWSFGFYSQKHQKIGATERPFMRARIHYRFQKVRPWEVSPVYDGEGINTGVESIKSMDSSRFSQLHQEGMSDMIKIARKICGY